MAQASTEFIGSSATCIVDTSRDTRHVSEIISTDRAHASRRTRNYPIYTCSTCLETACVLDTDTYNEKRLLEVDVVERDLLGQAVPCHICAECDEEHVTSKLHNPLLYLTQRQPHALLFWLCICTAAASCSAVIHLILSAVQDVQECVPCDAG